MPSSRAPALTEGLRIIELVAGEKDLVPFETIVQSVSMSRSSVNRLLANLVESGFLSTGTGRRSGYGPGIRLLALSRSCEKSSNVMRSIRSAVLALADEVQASVQYARLDRATNRIIVVAKAEVENSIHVQGSGGDITYSSHRHGIGQIILAYADDFEKRGILGLTDSRKLTEKTLLPGPDLDAYLAKVKKQGYAMEAEHRQPGLFRIAAPVFDSDSTIAGAVGCIWPAPKLDKPRADIILAKTRKLAQMLGTIT